VPDESFGEVFVDEGLESVEFRGGESVDVLEGRSGAGFGVDLEVVGSMRREDVGGGFFED
jgi:hypothetical protein